MLARGAGWDCQEFFEGEDAGFAAFPACLEYPVPLAFRPIRWRFPSWGF